MRKKDDEVEDTGLGGEGTRIVHIDVRVASVPVTRGFSGWTGQGTAGFDGERAVEGKRVRATGRPGLGIGGCESEADAGG